MEDDFQSRLKAVLSDPEALSKITEIARDIKSSDAENGTDREVSAENAEAAGKYSFPENTSYRNSVPPAPRGRNDSMTALLRSLRPLLREEKREKVDTLIKIMSAASLIAPIRGGK